MSNQLQPSGARKSVIKTALTAITVLGTLFAAAVELGPRLDATPRGQTPKNATLDAMGLRLAIPLLDPGIPSSEKKQYERGIWPELRNAEAMRIAIKLREQVAKRGTFREVVVSPDASVGAEFYLLARIDDSNGEDLNLRWSLVDATQTYRIPANCSRSNCWKTDNGRATKLSELETAAAARSVVFAAYFAPDLYGDAIREQRGRLKLEYLPSQDGDEWARIEAFRVRDERFAVLVSEQYGGFAEQMGRPYAEWQKENFPLARQARLARREATLSGIAGALGAVGAVAAAEDGKGGTAGALAALSAAAIANSLHERKEASALRDQINELGAAAQLMLKPMVVATQDRTVTLTGTAREQFTQWRTLLRDLYVNTSTDIEAVQFAEVGDG